MAGAPEVILVSDGEDSDVVFAGSSKHPLRPQRPVPIFVDSASSSSDNDEALPSLLELWRADSSTTKTNGMIALASPPPAPGMSGKGKENARLSKGQYSSISGIEDLDSDGLLDPPFPFDDLRTGGKDHAERAQGRARVRGDASVTSGDEPLRGGRKGRQKRKSDEGGETRPGDRRGVRKKRRSDESERSSLSKCAEVPRTARSKEGGGGRSSKEEKEAFKAKEKAEKQLAKETAKAAKEAERSYQKKVQEVNKLRTSKNDTVREIQLYLSHDLSLPSAPIAGALPEIEARLKENISSLHFSSPIESPVPGVIKFKRHLTARWHQPTKRFIPLADPRWVWEDTVIVVIEAEDVIDKIAHGQSMLGGWVDDARLSLGLKGKDQVFVMIKALGKFHAKTKVLQNREYTAAARAGLDGRAPEGGALASRPSKDLVERELVKLQVEKGVFIVHVEKTEDIEDWIWNLSADLAIRPYKLLSKSHLNFAPSDHPRKAGNPREGLELMLQEVSGITQSAAAGIVREYPTFRALMESFEKTEQRRGKEQAETMLEDCEVRNLKNGTANGRRLNKALAKRVYNVFRGEDSLALA